MLALAVGTKGGSDPFGMDAYGWRNILKKIFVVIGKTFQKLWDLMTSDKSLETL